MAMLSMKLGLLDLGDRPAEPAQFARGSDRDQRAALCAGLEARFTFHHRRSRDRLEVRRAAAA